MAKAVLDHSIRVYKEMEATAEYDESGNMVYTGYLTKLFESLGFSVPHYSNVTTELKRMGCIEQIQRGTAAQPSRWYLLQEPSEELYMLMPQATSNALGGTKMQDQLLQRIRALEERVMLLEGGSHE